MFRMITMKINGNTCAVEKKNKEDFDYCNECEYFVHDEDLDHTE